MAENTHLSFASVLLIVVLGFQASPTLAVPRQDHLSPLVTQVKEMDPTDIGTVISLGPNSINVKNERFTRVFQLDRKTSILRVDSTPLQIGDLVAVHCHFDEDGNAVADLIEANVDRWDGIITKMVGDTVYIKLDKASNRRAKIVFDEKTDLGYGYCSGKEPENICSRADLRVGSYLETVGFIVTPGELHATRVLSIQQRN